MKKIIVITPWFYPAYKAGGPIQSISNLISAIDNALSFSVITSAYDLRETVALTGIKVDEWVVLDCKGEGEEVPIWYGKRLTKSVFFKSLKEQEPTVVYINGMFSYRFVILPLLATDKSKIKVVLCPRGMLQRGALAGKSFKKKLYLSALKLSGLVKNITWHATNAEEEADIKKLFGKQAKIIIAANIPKQPVINMELPTKKPGKLRLIYLSLIAEKKNLLQVIELINKSAANITLDIYGPVKDAAYWKKCELAIADSSGKVKYMDDIRPELVQDTFAKYDASILLTKGENFGHALYESLSTGRPIITSYFTPWNELEQKRAGWNLDIADNDACLKILESICKMDNEPFNAYCNGAYEMAKLYYRESSDLSSYYAMFGQER